MAMGTDSSGHPTAGAEAPRSASLIHAISLGLAGYNKAFQLVGAYVVASPEAFIREPLQEIARAAGVSEPTVLRFCRQFGFKGLPDFRIALAMSLARDAGETRFVEPGVADKAVVNLGAKRAIARFALSLVGSDRSIIIDFGSTTQLFAENLRAAPGLIIMTTGLNIAETFRGASQHTVMLPGGTVRFSPTRSPAGWSRARWVACASTPSISALTRSTRCSASAPSTRPRRTRTPPWSASASG